MATDTTIFNQANKAITSDLKQELRLQGHYLTGALEASIVERIVEEDGGYTLTAEAAAYLESLENPTPAGSINISQDEYEQLIKWVILRGMATNNADGSKIASFIVAKWKKEGRPTKGSIQYSSTGKRTDVVKETFAKNQGKYTSLIDTAAVGSLDNQFHQIKSGTI